MIPSIGARDELSLAELTRAVCDFADAREWQQFHDPKNLAMALASEAGELSAILRWVSNAESDELVSAGKSREELRAEIGDVGICLLLLCARVGIDLRVAVNEKLNANATKYPIAESRGRSDPPKGLPR